jgi:hypothetical protein
LRTNRPAWWRLLGVAALMLALAAPAAYAGFKSGAYSGAGTESNEKLTANAIDFKVKKRKITKLSVEFDTQCDNHDLDNPDKPDFNESGTAVASKAIKVKKSGAFLYYFGDAEVEAPGDPRLGHIFFKGKLKGGKATGTVMVDYQKDVTPGFDDPENYEYYCGGGSPIAFKAKR